MFQETSYVTSNFSFEALVSHSNKCYILNSFIPPQENKSNIIYWSPTRLDTVGRNIKLYRWL